MLLAVDIGNTNVTAGVFCDETLVLVVRLASSAGRTAEQYAIELHASARLKNIDLRQTDGAIVSSVVPELTATVKNAVRLLTGLTPMTLGPGIKNGLDIKIDNPAQLGADLVAGAVAAVKKYPLPCLVADLGTATKISVIDKHAVYRGCTISPGVGISIKALALSASLLPPVNLESEDCPAFGTNTVASMRAGIILGFASMLDGLFDRIEASLGEKAASIVSTGGYAENIIAHCRRKTIYEPNLILEGLRLVYQKNTHQAADKK